MTLHSTNLSTGSSVNIPVQQHQQAPYSGVRTGFYYDFYKRLFDLTAVLLSLPVVVPLILGLAATIALTGNRPFYSQQRVGRGGKAFRMWKLRTMVKDADRQLEAYLVNNPQARHEWDSTQKLKDDPRITPLGRLLRKTSIDELPQLFNVLNGTMSLVGPRPMMVEQKSYYHGHAYYEMRPGITGLWQVCDRNNCTFQERVAFDNAYGRDVSFKTDLMVLFRTVAVVLRATGH